MVATAENKATYNKKNASAFTKDELKKIPSNIFILDKSGNSGFIPESYRYGDPSAPFIQFADTTEVPITSRVWDGEMWQPTQYVVNSSTIHVESVRDEKDAIIRRGLRDMSGMDLEKEYKRSVRAKIQFKKGILDLSEYGNDPILFEFLANHENNVDRPGYKELSKDARLNQLFTFRFVMKEAKAIIVTDNFEDRHNAEARILSLRKKDGKNISYDEAAIDAFITILGQSGETEGMTPGEKLEVLINKCRTKPIEMETLIDEELKEYAVTTGKAEALKVLEINKEGARIKGETNPFHSFKKSTNHTQLESLAYFFISQEGRDIYENIQLKIIAASVNASN